MDYEAETGWRGVERRDGVRVAVTHGSLWVVLPPGGRGPIVVCPCCDGPMSSETQAKFVADAVYPPA